MSSGDSTTYENLLVLITSRDCTRQLQQPVTERALAMVNVGNDTKVAESLEGNGGNALFEVGRFPFGVTDMSPGSSRVEWPPSRGAQTKATWSM